MKKLLRCPFTAEKPKPMMKKLPLGTSFPQIKHNFHYQHLRLEELWCFGNSALHFIDLFLCILICFKMLKMLLKSTERTQWRKEFGFLVSILPLSFFCCFTSQLCVTIKNKIFSWLISSALRDCFAH